MTPELTSAERHRLIERARTGSLLDAAYLIADFNRRCSITNQEPIDLRETVNILDTEEIAALNVKANALRADEGYFGGKRCTGRPLEEICEEMRERHPGFGQESYELALRRGSTAMR